MLSCFHQEDKVIQTLTWVLFPEEKIMKKCVIGILAISLGSMCLAGTGEGDSQGGNQGFSPRFTTDAPTFPVCKTVEISEESMQETIILNTRVGYHDKREDCTSDGEGGQTCKDQYFFVTNYKVNHVIDLSKTTLKESVATSNDRVKICAYGLRLSYSGVRDTKNSDVFHSVKRTELEKKVVRERAKGRRFWNSDIPGLIDIKSSAELTELSKRDNTVFPKIRNVSVRDNILTFDLPKVPSGSLGNTITVSIEKKGFLFYNTRVIEVVGGEDDNSTTSTTAGSTTSYRVDLDMLGERPLSNGKHRVWVYTSADGGSDSTLLRGEANDTYNYKFRSR